MGNDVGVYNTGSGAYRLLTGYNTWLSSRLQKQRCSFVHLIFSLFSSIFFRCHAFNLVGLVGSAVLISFSR